jgi:phosphatidylethanolamine-binding protein (PEBP) family uncharacterized protein
MIRRKKTLKYKKRARSRKRTLSKKKGGGSGSSGSSGSGPQLSIIYANIGTKPQITLSNYKAPYLLTMLDPDAPAGTWTHYVAIIKDKTLLKELYAYEPPNPPPGTGVHRYKLQAYELPPAAQANVLNNTANLQGNKYYIKVLKPFLQDKKKIGNEVVFTKKAP